MSYAYVSLSQNWTGFVWISSSFEIWPQISSCTIMPARTLLNPKLNYVPILTLQKSWTSNLRTRFDSNVVVDVISKQQIMNESARGEKSGPAGCCCCCCHSTRQILLLNTLYKRFINQAIVLRLKSLMQHYFFSFVSMSFMK